MFAFFAPRSPDDFFSRRKEEEEIQFSFHFSRTTNYVFSSDEKQNLLHAFQPFFSEIGKVRSNLFQINGKKNEPLVLPEGVGPPVTLSEKVYVPIKEHPDVSLSFY